MQLASAVDSGELHVRFFMQLTEGTVLPEQLIVFELWYDEAEISERITVFLNDQGIPSVFVGSAMMSFPAVQPVIRDQWACLELAMTLDDLAGIASLSLDGKEIARGEGLDTTPPQPFRMAVAESLPYGDVSNGNVTLFLDELVVATERVGCALE